MSLQNPVTNTVYVTNFGSFARGRLVGDQRRGLQRRPALRLGREPASVTVGAGPWGLAIGQAANTIYVANNYSGDSTGQPVR